MINLRLGVHFMMYFAYDNILVNLCFGKYYICIHLNFVKGRKIDIPRNNYTDTHNYP